jgi:hypothetical protein
MKIAFYVAAHGDKWDKFIAWWTGGPYSHCELVFSDGMAYSSSPRDGGCRFKRIKWSPDHWVFVDLPCDAHEDEIRAFCEKENGKPYDYVGVMGLVIHQLLWRYKKKWYCSELCALVRNRCDDEPSKAKKVQVDPNKLYKALI